jgi:hypothetical protein
MPEAGGVPLGAERTNASTSPDEALTAGRSAAAQVFAQVAVGSPRPQQDRVLAARLADRRDRSRSAPECS